MSSGGFVCRIPYRAGGEGWGTATPLMRCPMVRQRRAAAPLMTTGFIEGQSERTRKSRQAGKIAVADCQSSSRRGSLAILVVAPLREPTRSFRCTLARLSHAGTGGRESLLMNELVSVGCRLHQSALLCRVFVVSSRSAEVRQKCAGVVACREVEVIPCPEEEG